MSYLRPGVVDTNTSDPLPSDPMATLAKRRALRAIGAVRRSKRMSYEDPSTTPARQTAAIQSEEDRGGLNIVGWAKDLGVSAGDVPPWERPELGPWMTTEKVAEYDAIIWARYDRAIRHMRDMHKLSEWAIEHRKMIIFVVGPNDGPRMELDFRNGPLDTMANLYLMLFAFAAEMEWNAIRERNRDTAAFLRQAGRWGGGRHPYHLMPMKLGKEWRLIHNPDTAKVVLEAISLILDEGKTASEVAEIFTERGIPAPFDYAAMRADRIFTAPVAGRVIKVEDRRVTIKPSEGGDLMVIEPHNKRDVIAVTTNDRVEKGDRLSVQPPWHRNAVIKILESKSLIGSSEFEGKPVLDSEGSVVKRAEPLIDRELFRKVNDAIRSNSPSTPERQVKQKNAGEFLNIAFCIHCGFSMHKTDRPWAKASGEKVVYPYIRCRQAVKKLRPSDHGKAFGCNATNIRTDHLTDIVRSVLLSTIGDLEVMERKFIPGQSHEAELEEAQESLAFFLGEVATKGPNVAKVYRKQIEALEALIGRLSEAPVTEDRFEEVPTGISYRSLWTGAKGPALRKLLLETGVRVEVGPFKNGTISIGSFDRPERYDDAVTLGEANGIAYAIYLPRDLAKRATRRDLTAEVVEQKVLELSR